MLEELNGNNLFGDDNKELMRLIIPKNCSLFYFQGSAVLRSNSFRLLDTAYEKKKNLYFAIHIENITFSVLIISAEPVVYLSFAKLARN